MSSLIHPSNSDITSAPQSAQQQEIALSQAKVLLKCGARAVRIDISISDCSHRYSLGVYAGFEGGGRDEEHSLAPRTQVRDCCPMFYDALKEQMVEAWPPMVPTERRIDGVIFERTELPQIKTPQRLERAMQVIEPMLRQLVNQRQKQLESQDPPVNDQPLIARIKAILRTF